MKKNLNPVRGTMDYLPKASMVREELRKIILENYRKNGFMQIQTPILESLELLQGSDGGDNLKLMFKTLKRGESLNLSLPNLSENDIAGEGLRYDLTVPLVRMFCNNKEELPLPFKAIQLDYSFRAERPQRGRNRQFIQCDVDIIGDKTINAEIEVLGTGLDTLNKLGFKDTTIKINDRRILNELILSCGFEESQINTICVSLDKLDKIDFSGVEEELSKKEFPPQSIEKLLNAVKKIKSSGLKSLKQFGISPQLADNIETIIETLNKLTFGKVKIEYEITIVRGQGYYTGTIYEVYAEGMRGAIAAGGRYDAMVEKLLGVDLPAIGFSIGFEPISILKLENLDKLKLPKKIALLYDENESFEAVLKMKKELMEQFDCTVYRTPKNLRNLLEKLKNCGVNFYTFFDDFEIKPID